MRSQMAKEKGKSVVVEESLVSKGTQETHNKEISASTGGTTKNR